MADRVSMQELERAESEWVSSPSPILCVRFADLLRRAGRRDESLEIASEGLKRWRSNVSISIVLGKCYLESGLDGKALETFQEVLSAQPQNLIALRSLADIHFRRKEWSEARRMLEDYLFENPADEEARSILKETEARLNDPLAGSSAAAAEEEDEQEEGAFPDTDRMKKVLQSQGLSGVPEEGASEEAPADDAVPEGPEDGPEQSSPGCLLEFFSETERRELNLDPYDGED